MKKLYVSLLLTVTIIVIASCATQPTINGLWQSKEWKFNNFIILTRPFSPA